jgi:hypothetical protein
MARTNTASEKWYASKYVEFKKDVLLLGETAEHNSAFQ